MDNSYLVPEKESLNDSFKLRWKVFTKELGWAKSKNETKSDRDNFDTDTKHFFKYYNGKLVGTARLHSYKSPWMLDKEFSDLIPADIEIIKRPNTSEITRLAVDKMMRGKPVYKNKKISNMLIDEISQYANENNIEYSYAVVSKKMNNFLKENGVECSSISEFVLMPDGVEAAIILVHWKNYIIH